MLLINVYERNDISHNDNYNRVRQHFYALINVLSKENLNKENLNKESEKKMKEFSYVIKDEIGIHARPAGLLVKEAKAFASKITIEANGKNADVTRLMAVMGLGVKKGTEVIIRADGADEDAAVEKMKEFFSANL